MDATAAAASVAAISGLAAYVNGKYHIAQDLKALRFKKRAGSYYEELGMYRLPRALLDSSHTMAHAEYLFGANQYSED
jgi:hypothetical protein